MLAPKSEPAPGPFTFEAYLEWEAAQEEKWELVDGYAYRRSDRWHYDPATGMAAPPGRTTWWSATCWPALCRACAEALAARFRRT